MSRRLERRIEAIRDLDRHFLYIAERSLDAAHRFLVNANETFQDLLRLPYSGTLCRFNRRHMKDIRQWRIRGFENYLVFYRVNRETLEIIRIEHAARNWQESLEVQ